jgi:hypothetical protein
MQVSLRKGQRNNSEIDIVTCHPQAECADADVDRAIEIGIPRHVLDGRGHEGMQMERFS